MSELYCSEVAYAMPQKDCDRLFAAAAAYAEEHPECRTEPLGNPIELLVQAVRRDFRVRSLGENWSVLYWAWFEGWTRARKDVAFVSEFADALDRVQFLRVGEQLDDTECRDDAPVRLIGVHAAIGVDDSDADPIPESDGC